MTLRVLIIGGYGTFGGRLVRLLAQEAGLELLVAGRSLARAESFCATQAGMAALRPARFDRDGDLPAQLRALAPALVVDASGPFQAYGPAPYRLAEAAIDAGIHYLDLADPTAFVCGITRLDAAAKAAGVFVISGASSVPVLNFAAARALSQDFLRLETLGGGIAPSPMAQMGLNVMRSMCAGAGQMFWRTGNGQRTRGFGMLQSRRFTICPPGCLPLPSLRFCLVDTPDQQLAPLAWPALRDVWMGAATRPQIWLRLFQCLALLVRWRLLPSLTPLATLFHFVADRLRWGEPVGGMFVEVSGQKADGARATRAWHLLAQGDNGPFIPAMASAILVRRLLAGPMPAPGARPATSDHELADFAAMFAQLGIVTGTTEAGGAGPLYRRILGTAFDHLSGAIRAFHDHHGAKTMRGHAFIERGTHLFARFAAAIFGLPVAGTDIPVEVTVTPRDDGSELWQRNFAGRRFASVRREGSGRWERLACERYGPFTFALALVTSGGRLSLVVRHWRCLGMPLPRWLAPCGDVFEYSQDGKFGFHVEIATPFTGLILRCRGWLE